MILVKFRLGKELATGPATFNAKAKRVVRKRFVRDVHIESIRELAEPVSFWLCAFIK